MKIWKGEKLGLLPVYKLRKKAGIYGKKMPVRNRIENSETSGTSRMDSPYSLEGTLVVE
jgi:hypothetical protein